MRISVIMPIHNEEEYLPYSLRQLDELKGKIHEFIFIIDNCKDKSERIIQKFALKHPNCKIFYVKEHKWLNKPVENYDFGAQHATGNYIYFIDADTIVDPKIFKKEIWKKGNALRFRYYNYNLYGSKIPYAYEKVLLKIAGRLGFAKGQCFVLAFRRNYWRKIRFEAPPEDIEGFLKCPKIVLKHILEQTDKKIYKYITDTECLHLRPKLTKGQQLLQGVARLLLKYPFWKVLLHSILRFKIYILIGYLQAKNGNYGNLKSLRFNQ